MSHEAMTTELMIEAYWKIKGYWTEVRVPFNNKKDFDVIAYDPNSKTLVISEAKAQAAKNTVYLYHRGSKEKFHKEYSLYLDKFIQNINHVWKPGFKFEKFGDNVDFLVIQLMSNTYIEEAIKEKAEEDIKNYFYKLNPDCPNNIEIEIRLDNFMDLFVETLQIIKKDKQSRRYENHILDFMRELDRYANPVFSGQRNGGNIKEKYYNSIRDGIKYVFENAFKMENKSE